MKLGIWRSASFGVALGLLGLLGCAPSAQSGLRFKNRAPVWQVSDQRHVGITPAPRGFPRFRYYFDQFFYRRVARLAEAEKHRHAVNVNSLDEVPDSTWFENRIERLTPADVQVGPNRGQGPSRIGKWIITGTKVGGKSAGLLIRDHDGVKYILKFDEPGYPEIETAANVIAQRILWACGFNVPEDDVVVFRPADLALAEDAVIADTFGNKRRMTEADLADVFTRIEVANDGTVRGMASRFLAGKPLGGVPPEGVREDDPNDVVAHQDRRELRGQFVIFSWLDHTDVKEDNTLDMLVADEDGRQFVRHYLVDFGKALGTAGAVEGRVDDGFAFLVDFQYILASTFGLGLWRRPWEGAVGPAIRGVGRYESERFRPGTWRPAYPWPPFLERDRFDGYWGAKLVARFSSEMIRAAVLAGQYTDPAALEYITNTLIARRAKILRYWFAKVSPLDDFELTGDELCFRDLNHVHGLRDAARATYAVRAFDYRGANLAELAPFAALGGDAKNCLVAPVRGETRGGYTILAITPRHGAKAQLAVEVHLADGPSGRRIIGVVRR